MRARCSPLPATERGFRDSSLRPIGAYDPGAGKAVSAAFAAFLRWTAPLLLVLVAACSSPPPEEALRATIAQMQAAAEARDSAALSDHLAEDFVGPNGMDREQFRRWLAVLWLRNREVGVTLGPLEVEMLGETARVKFTAAATGGEGLLPDRADVLEVHTGWRLEDDEWMLISAEWE
jgi:hypothetical protein